MNKIHFKANIIKINSCSLLRLPEEASQKLPSRGMVMVEGTIDGTFFQAPMEPDGEGSHWLKVPPDLAKTEGAQVELALEPVKEWPDPVLPSDLEKALTEISDAQEVWSDITPMARWDWIRWIGSTKNKETRKKRIQVACDKMKAGKRRPCCFNRNLCCDTTVSKNGILQGSSD